MAANAGNTQDLIEIQELRDNVIMLKSGAICQIVMVGGINFALKSEEEQNVIVSTYQNFLNSMDFPLQIMIHSRRVNIEKYLDTLEGRKNTEVSGLLRNQISEYQEFVRGFVGQFAIMRKLFLVVVPFYPVNVPSTQKLSNLLPFFGKKTETANEDELTFKEHVSHLEQRDAQVIDGLRPVGVETAVLTNEQLIELFYNFYNPDTVERENVIQKENA